MPALAGIYYNRSKAVTPKGKHLDPTLFSVMASLETVQDYEKNAIVSLENREDFVNAADEELFGRIEINTPQTNVIEIRLHRYGGQVAVRRFAPQVTDGTNGVPYLENTYQVTNGWVTLNLGSQMHVEGCQYVLVVYKRSQQCLLHGGADGSLLVLRRFHDSGVILAGILPVPLSATMDNIWVRLQPVRPTENFRRP